MKTILALFAVFTVAFILGRIANAVFPA